MAAIALLNKDERNLASNEFFNALICQLLEDGLVNYGSAPGQNNNRARPCQHHVCLHRNSSRGLYLK